MARGLARLFAARNNGPDGRGVFDSRISRLAQRHRPGDDADRRFVFRQRRRERNARLALSSLSGVRTSHRRHHDRRPGVVQSGNSRHFRRAHLHPPRLLQRAAGDERQRVLGQASVRLHALGVHLHRHGGHRICHQVIPHSALAPLAHQALCRPLAWRASALRDGAHGNGRGQPRPAHRRGREPLHRRGRGRLRHLFLHHSADLHAEFGRFLFHSPVEYFRAARLPYRQGRRAAGMVVLGGAGLRAWAERSRRIGSAAR